MIKASKCKVSFSGPFGMVMPSRQFQAGIGYRYGFNGMEKDDEIKGTGNHLDFGARGLDTRLGRWLRVDPLGHEYPDISTYTFAANNPIYYIDPDGKKLIVADEAQQAVVMGYLKEQLGADIFSFNKKGQLRLDKKAFKAAQGGFSKEQLDVAAGLTRVVKSSRIIEARIYPNKDINFSRNPLVPVQVDDPETGGTRTEYKPMFEGGKGYTIPELTQGGSTIFIKGDDRAFILINQASGQTETFDSEEGKTTPCEGCLFIHEVLDHGLDYINSGNIDEPKGATKKDNVQFHNKALKNVGSKERTGKDHD